MPAGSAVLADPTAAAVLDYVAYCLFFKGKPDG